MLVRTFTPNLAMSADLDDGFAQTPRPSICSPRSAWSSQLPTLCINPLHPYRSVDTNSTLGDRKAYFRSDRNNGVLDSSHHSA